MTTKAYAALLRGINVGGHKKVPMAGLRELLTELGHGDVRTYLQSGNAVFTSAVEDEEALAAQLRQAIWERFGFDVGVLVRGHAYLRAVADACPFPAASLEGRQLHVTFFSEPVDAARFASVEAARYAPEEFRLGDRALYLYAPDGLGRSKLAEVLTRATPAKSGIVATSRNWNTVVKLVEWTAA
ncbi:hypothetical protein BLA24_19860 [Streptomyces cinnamoneus]|uniref:Uncharacterized protein n=1 Tax=Streptomyces cinnamoneus TaxID=53446 RepID=A0A2G1XF83_STRCJ|nr:DUF1697 domain-containing protein [Streptomyces cinnamoneus]PHQ49893.1 hypothetical protein BLA24_19860 [Streptomyces cinnamoneus]PPT13331.1 DUF1697 domain-containing protein [Streptomyces cinnamoneus]